MTTKQIKARLEQAIADGDTDALKKAINELNNRTVDKIENEHPEAVGLFKRS